MKRFRFIFLGALVILMAGCSKKNLQVTPDEDAWVTDLSLPVPIQFGSSSFLETKAGIESVEDLADKTLGIYGLAKNDGADWTNYEKNPDVLLYNNRAAVENGVIVLKDKDGNSIKEYYPRESSKNYSFYGVYPRFLAAVLESDGLYVNVGPTVTPTENQCQLGKTDIIWAKAEATPVKDVDTSVEVDGYNAKYMRTIRKAGLTAYSANAPSFDFKHATAGLKLKALANMDGDTGLVTEDDFKNIKIKKITVKDVYTSGRLCVAGEEIGEIIPDPNSKSDIVVSFKDGINPTKDGVELGEFFPYPDDDQRHDIEIEVDNGIESYTLSYDMNDFMLKVGQMTTINFVFNKLDELSINVNSVKWDGTNGEEKTINEDMLTEL